ncbi:MAG: hypothetical protein R3E58_04690 [Phycisphaerae bacterium]
MKAAIVFLVCGLLSSVAVGSDADGDVVLEVSWSELADEIKANEFLSTNGDVLVINNTKDQPLRVAIATIDRPAITRMRYALVGRIRYENVSGNGYLEMLNTFKEGTFFTKSISESGPLGFVKGTSNWRAYELPFNSKGASGSPIKIEVNLILPGKGSVWIESMTLVQINVGPPPAPNTKPVTPAKNGVPVQRTGNQSAGISVNGWWSSQSAGLWGGILGSLIGVLGAIIGVLASKGKARTVVMVILNLVIAFGVISVIAGIAAISMSQPYAVYYPLLMMGVFLYRRASRDSQKC